MVAEIGTPPGFIADLYFALLACPLPDEALAATSIHGAGDMPEGIAALDDTGSWCLTPLGRELAAHSDRDFMITEFPGRHRHHQAP